MEKLETVPMPWRILTCYDLCGFAWTEKDGLRVKVKVCFSAADEARRAQAMIAQGVPEEEALLQSQEALVALTFPSVFHVSMQVNTAVVNRQLEVFDLSGLPRLFGSTLREEWDLTGVCPDSGLYRIVDPMPLSGMELPPDRASHWVVRGHDQLLRIVSPAFRWTEIPFD